MLTRLYRKLVPKKSRDKLYSLFLADILFFTRNFRVILNAKTKYILYPFIEKTEINQAWAFMGRHGITSYPFDAALKYKKLVVDVLFDSTYNMNYILHKGKKLFFPKHMTETEIKNLYISLVLEQDVDSPHRYVSDTSILKDKILIDVGSAEGIFSLETIELTKAVFLFECEDYWIEALNATFAPWKEKVQIIKRYISDVDNADNMTLDTLYSGKNFDHLFLKMDIEGAEQSALRGAKDLLQACSDVIASVCIYHRENDAEEINVFFEALGYKTELTQGFLFWDKALRRGVLRAKKNEK